MKPPESGREFVELLTNSQLLCPKLLEKIKPQFKSFLDKEPRSLAKALIKNQLLSNFQARNLLAGKHKGFFIGKYRILEIIGQGGMGQVILAEQIAMERLVALKVISKEKLKKGKEELLARFRREAKAVAALNHPNIVRAYDFEELGGNPYIVMEFVEGVDLQRLINKEKKVDPGFAAEIMQQTLSGLHEAHEAGLVHRDIKPGNLLIDAKGNVHILDLGLCALQANPTDDSLTVDQSILGTVDFMAPEQAENSSKVDHRSDLYSVAASIYSALRGDVMYPGYTPAQKLIAQRTEEPKNIRDLVPEVPEGFATLIHKMLSKDPDQRPASALSVIEDLKQWANRSENPIKTSLILFPKADFVPLLGRGPKLTELSSSDSSMNPQSTISTSSGIMSGQSLLSKNSTQYIPDSEESFSSEPPPAKVTKKKQSSPQGTESALANVPPQAWIGGGVGLVLLLAIGLFASGMFSSSDAESVAQTPATPATPVNSTEESSAPDPQTTTEKAPMEVEAPPEVEQYVPLSLFSAANTDSTSPMFYDMPTDVLVLEDWGPKTVDGIKFNLINPTLGKPNVLLLYGSQGDFPPEKPKSATVACNRKAKKIHLLSGVAGWGYPVEREQQEVMRVRLLYESGETEDHIFNNGYHFVDFIKRIDASGSKFAFLAGEHQMRYLTITPEKQELIHEIEFLKGPLDEVSPIVMAVTIEPL